MSQFFTLKKFRLTRITRHNTIKKVLLTLSFLILAELAMSASYEISIIHTKNGDQIPIVVKDLEITQVSLTEIIVVNTTENGMEDNRSCSSSKPESIIFLERMGFSLKKNKNIYQGSPFFQYRLHLTEPWLILYIRYIPTKIEDELLQRCISKTILESLCI